jgi:subtilisin-like proprotein convertase family protein
VGSVGKNGKHADYSTAGAALLVSAPAGNEKDFGHLMTAGLGVDTCANSGPGTSFACPVVSGVVALLLEANSELSWRDVQGILAATSQNVYNDDEDDTITINPKNYWHSNWYGFGIIDAKAAVEAALDWQLVGEELQAVGISTEENAILADTNNNEFTSKITLDPEDDNYPEDFIAESTVVLLDLSHYNRGDLEIELVSPSGTSSILNPGKRPESSQLKEDERWKLMTLKNWGEDPTGKWKLKIRDLVDRDQGVDQNVFRDWKLIVYGRKASDNEFEVPPVPTEFSEVIQLPTAAPTQVEVDIKLPTAAPTQVEEDKEPPAEKICLSDFSPACEEKSNGNTLCPANTIFVLGNGDEDELTMDADYVCPTDKLEGDDTKAAVDKASQEGLCTCKARLFDWDCSLIEEDMECDCVACPSGSTLSIAYTCKKPIASDCLAFNCDGACIQFVGDPEPIDPTPEDLTDVASKDVRPVDESEQSQWCLDPFSVNNSCEELGNGQTKCPARTTMLFDNSKSDRYDDEYTIDADLFCPTDLLEEEGIEFGEATRQGLCTCEAGLYNIHCDQIEEDLECECFECPSGSVLRIGYQCNKEIANGCTSFNCDGSCTEFFSFPSAAPSEGPTAITQKPTNPPTRNPTPGPTRKPTTNPTQYPTFKADKFVRKTEAPSFFPTSMPSESPSTIPTEPPTAFSSDGPSFSFEPSESPTVSPVPTFSPTGIANALISDGGDGNRNLSCEKAELMNLDDEPVEGTIRKKLVSQEGHCLSGLETVGGWYQVIGNGDVITLTACSLDVSKSVGVSVLTGPCSEAVCLEHRSKQIVDCKYGNGHALSFASEQDKVYSVLVSGIPVGAPLQSSIAVSSTTAAELRRNLQKNLISDFQMWGTTSKAPENSKCGAPELADFVEPIFGDTLGLLPTYNTCQDSQKSGAWYEVNGGTPIDDTGIIVYEANTCNSVTNFYQSMSVFRGESCGSLSCVDVDVLPCPSGFFGEQVYWSTSKQENYKIFVHSSDAEEADIYNAGEFKMNLNAADRLPNDQCSAAIDIAKNRVGAVNSTTAGAKPDMFAIENSSCEIGGAGAWYMIEGDGETFQASTCSLGTDHKTEIHVYSGECGKLNCIDLGAGNKALCEDGRGAIVNFKTQVGVVYYILVTGRKEGANGNFALDVMEIKPPNNNGCGAAKALEKGTPVDGSTLRATVDFPTGDNCVIPLDTPGVWYELEGKGKGVKVSTCQDNEFDSAISIFSGTCGKLSCVAGSSAANSDCLEGQGAEVSFFGEKDTTYLVYVHGKSESNNNMGDFTVSFDHFNMLESNEFCSDATVVPTDGTRVQGSTQDATQSSIPDTSCGIPINNPGLWYTFEGNGQPHQIEACSEDKGDFDVSVSVYEGGPNGGDCDDITCITGINFFGDVCSKAQLGRRVLQAGSASNFRFMTENLQNYYIFVHGTEGVGDFSMWVRDENIAGFGTAAPTETPVLYGKDLYRWIPINTEGLEIATDYTDLEFVSTPSGLATIEGYMVNYTSAFNFTGSDNWTMDGCFNGECFRFDVTVNVMGDGYGDTVPETKGASKLWLLLLLLLLCLIPLCCLPFYLWHKKKKEEEQKDIDDDYSDDDRSGSQFDDEDSYDDSQDEKGLLPNQQSSKRSQDDDDWGSSGGSDDDVSRDSRGREGSDYSGSQSESDDDGFNDGFDDEYKASPSRR